MTWAAYEHPRFLIYAKGPVKGTICVNSSDPPYKNGNVRFTYELDINVYFFET